MAASRGISSIVAKGLNSVMVFLLSKMGANLQGAQALEVTGRASGEIRRVPVNPVTVGSNRYRMSPRGETNWVKNIRASREATLRHGRTAETFTMEEMPDEEKVPVLRAYLDRWHWQVGKIMNVPKDVDDLTLRKIAPKHPIFRIAPTS